MRLLRYQMKAHAILRSQLNIQHVETSVASHCKQFERPIESQSQVNYM